MVKQNDRGLLCGELAKTAEVSPDTIRHYEKIGVLPKAQRSASGYRIYPQSAIERVTIVRRALRIGFTLSELAEVLKAHDSGGAPCHRVYDLAQAKLHEIVTDIAAMQQTESHLRVVLADWKKRMERADKGKKAHLLHSLNNVPKNFMATRNEFRRRKT